MSFQIHHFLRPGGREILWAVWLESILACLLASAQATLCGERQLPLIVRRFASRSRRGSHQYNEQSGLLQSSVTACILWYLSQRKADKIESNLHAIKNFVPESAVI